MNAIGWRKTLSLVLKKRVLKTTFQKEFAKWKMYELNLFKILWFFLECPERSSPYENPESLRKIYIKQKLADLNPTVPEPRKRK